MAIDPAGFKRALGQFASGVTVVTTVDEAGEPLGLTVSSLCSVSLTPPLVLVCIDLRSDSHPGFREQGRFAVSVLRGDQEEISERFAWGGDEKFAQTKMTKGPSGLPLVRNSVARMECRVVGAHAAGDHVVYIGEVEHAEVDPGPPLVYHAGAYHVLPGPGEP